MKIKLTFLFLAIVFIFSTSVLSQTGSNAILRGQLLKANGKPLPYTEIELVPIESDKIVVDAKLVAISSVSGKFTFFDVPNGKYTLSINFDDKPTDLSPFSTFFYPKSNRRSEAEIFEVTDKKLIKTIVFQVPPPLLQIKITGKVISDKGEPMPNVYVDLIDLMFDESISFRLQTDKNGNFTLKGFENRIYQVSAILLEKPINSFEPPKPLAISKSDAFILTAKTPSLTLTLKEKYNTEDGRVGR